MSQAELEPGTCIHEGFPTPRQCRKSLWASQAGNATNRLPSHGRGFKALNSKALCKQPNKGQDSDIITTTPMLPQLPVPFVVSNNGMIGLHIQLDYYVTASLFERMQGLLQKRGNFPAFSATVADIKAFGGTAAVAASNKTGHRQIFKPGYTDRMFSIYQ